MAANDRGFGEKVNEFLVRDVVRLKEWLARLLKPGSLIVAALVTLTGVGFVLREAAIPDQSFWASRSVASATLAIIGALTYVGYLLVVLGYRRTLTVREQDARLYAVCREVAALVDRETSLEGESIGVHVWSIRGLPGIRRLERRATFLLVDRPHSPITWRKGKGVLGVAWQRDDFILANLEPLANAPTEEEFYALPREERFNFTWQEARATQHYKAALVLPLHGGPENAPKIIGCLSIDVQSEGAVGELDRLWTTHRADVNAHIAVCQGILGGA